jgi:predicted membrane channel-forming protein YqfA (hemolysin III family)
MIRVVGLAVVVLGVVVVAAPMPLDDAVAVVLRLLGLVAVLLGVWIWATPNPEPDDDFEDFVFDHVDTVRDLFDDARERLMSIPVDQIDDKVCRHAEVIFGSKYYA